ncbi:MAG: acyl-ACP--UDP-N-acetylglucosamine O-acyltransferase [Candidatus Acidiferrales bacterium]|jgi:UDP-N-acetylglucosamine acyltransferase
MSQIDARAIISPSAKLGSSVRIGPYAIVGDGVELGDGCIVENNAILTGPARLGRENHFYSCCAIGGVGDLGDPGARGWLEVGDANEFREFSTVSHGTDKGGSGTRIGSYNLIMSYVNIAHDCLIGNHTILVNGAQLAGRIQVEDYATIGSFCRVNQSCRVGSHSYITGDSVITDDVLPFSLVVAQRETRCYGMNKVGLEKCGFSSERIQSIEQAYRFLLRSKLNTTQAVEKILETLSQSEDVLAIIRFIESAAERGLTK